MFRMTVKNERAFILYIPILAPVCKYGVPGTYRYTGMYVFKRSGTAALGGKVQADLIITEHSGLLEPVHPLRLPSHESFTGWEQGVLHRMATESPSRFAIWLFVLVLVISSFTTSNLGIFLEDPITFTSEIVQNLTEIVENLTERGEDGTSNSTRSLEIGALPIHVREKIQAYMNIPVTKRPLPPKTPGLYLHVGKAGGSTLSSVLRNACHSFVPKPCKDKKGRTKDLANETYMSMLTTYMHTPDFPLLGKKKLLGKLKPYKKFAFYIASVRDPLSKFQSVFTYTHPANGQENVVKPKKFAPCYNDCFPSLERFAELVGDNPKDFDYPYPKSELVTTNCSDLAMATMAGVSQGCSVHPYWNMKRIFERIPGWQDSQSPPTFMVIRTEHMSEDFSNINKLLGELHPGNLTNKKKREVKVYEVGKNVTSVGRRRLCFALLDEYKVYIKALSIAINLSEQERWSSLQLSQQNCPDLPWLFETAPKILAAHNLENESTKD